MSDILFINKTFDILIINEFVNLYVFLYIYRLALRGGLHGVRGRGDAVQGAGHHRHRRVRRLRAFRCAEGNSHVFFINREVSTGFFTTFESKSSSSIHVQPTPSMNSY